VVSGLVVAATWGSGAVHAQRTAGLNTTQTIQISGATKVLDLASGDESQAPPNWTSGSFDDSSWQPASQLSSDVASCASQYASGLQSLPSYWGANEGDQYLFRQSFTLPTANNYYGSVITFGGNVSGDDTTTGVDLYINNQQVDAINASAFRHDAIGKYLHSGTNVIAFYAAANNNGQELSPSGQPCSAVTFTANIVVTGVKTSAPARPTPATLSTVLPGRNAVLTGNSLPFSWNRYNGASYYYLQMWMDNAGPGQRITSRTTTTYTARLTGTSFNLNVSHFAKGTYSWRMAAVGGAGNLLTVWTPDQRVTLR